MSEYNETNPETPQVKEPTLKQEIVRNSAISAAASAASIVGLFGGLMLVGKLFDLKDRKSKNDDVETQESPES